MKRVFILNIVMATIILIGCQKEPSVLEFDAKYSPKKPTSTIKKDALPPVDLFTVSAYFANSQEELNVKRLIQLDDSKSVEDISSVTLDVKTTIPVEEETIFKIERITKEDEVYPTIVKGLTVELPSEAYSINNDKISLEKGAKIGSTTITFNKDEFLTLDKAKNYVIPVKLEVTQGTAKVVNNFVLQVNIKDIQLLPQGNNVESVKSLPEGMLYNRGNISLDSNYKTFDLDKLKDGEKDQTRKSWETNSNSDTWLTLSLKQTKTVKAISFISYSITFGTSEYGDGTTLKSVKVFVSQDDGDNYVEQGSVHFDPDTYKAYVVFKKPVKIKKIKFTDFVGYKDIIKLHEIELKIVNP